MIQVSIPISTRAGVFTVLLFVCPQNPIVMDMKRAIPQAHASTTRTIGFMHRLTATVIIALLGFTSVSCDSSSSSPNPCNPGTFTASVNGQPYAAACILVTVASGVTSISAYDSIDGSIANAGRVFTLAVSGTTPGTYSAPAQTTMIFADSQGTSVRTTASASGQLVLTEVSASRVRGSFSFSGQETLGGAPTGQTITAAGEFDIQR
jgi:hypothetical protein